ncbi:hypothetical protein GEV33_002806 [Tenebrio molitor]|uniref:Uncharacterized protein n=1 Tax=Tenebrio molitor TaxID=7067 RepID=A0A8J6HJM3_TENMO|nr:hypothetical protein GEV33_002806 [Tenebrio molitor]
MEARSERPDVAVCLEGQRSPIIYRTQVNAPIKVSRLLCVYYASTTHGFLWALGRKKKLHFLPSSIPKDTVRDEILMRESGSVQLPLDQIEIIPFCTSVRGIKRT